MPQSAFKKVNFLQSIFPLCSCGFSPITHLSHDALSRTWHAGCNKGDHTEFLRIESTKHETGHQKQRYEINLQIAYLHHLGRHHGSGITRSPSRNDRSSRHGIGTGGTLAHSPNSRSVHRRQHGSPESIWRQLEQRLDCRSG